MNFLAFATIACSFSVCFGHLCLLSPPQRGSMTGLNKAGSDDCILLKTPCGGRPSQSGQLALKSESNFTVLFQKNLDHYTSASPGYFTISFGDGESSEFKEAARIVDMGEPNLHLYSVQVTLPALVTNAHKIIQVSYVTKNAQAPPAFYQCADFMLF